MWVDHKRHFHGFLSFFFASFYQDQVANIHWHCWKDRLHKRKLKLTEFKGDALKASKDITFKWHLYSFNPLSANSGQHLFSPNNIHTLLREMVARIKQMITKEKMLCSFIKFYQLKKKCMNISLENLSVDILGLKGLKAFSF